ncbi:MAG: peptidoglycan bridge formation glycyltransferase FemA/FemB family protein [Patescibacteria group bacterium]
MARHVLQSELWEKFKNSYGTPAVRVGNVLYTKHKIPFSSDFYAYSPRVNPFDIDFDRVKASLEENSCVAIHFDVPNVIKESSDSERAINIFKDRCSPSTRDEFAKGNFLLDLTRPEEELLNNMHKKHRYNVKYAQGKGVVVRQSTDDADFDIFYNLYSETGGRAKFFARSKNYMEKAWRTFRDAGCGRFVIAELDGKPLTAWLLINYDNVLYYPYGGSTNEDRNVQSSCLVGWEAIKLGKKLGCTLFDMWGASEDMSNKSDPYFGFSLFKEKFGAKHVVYIPSYDFVLNAPVYKLFTAANAFRWKLLNLLR